jgi:hypothetical protein
MGQNDVDLTSDGDASTPNTTMIWGHSHNDEMQGKDAFVSLTLDHRRRGSADDRTSL